MGKKLDALLGRTPKTSKLKRLLNLALSRIAVLKNQRHVRCSHDRSDVVQLLNLGHVDRALHRVEHVITEQNMLDVFVMVENYNQLLIERVMLVESSKECPEELVEAVPSLIFAASRCGEFPELKEIRGILAARLGKEFVARAVELRNNCRVNPQMIEKLSGRQASLESRQTVLKQIASDNRISLLLGDDVYGTAEEKLDINTEEQLHHTTGGASGSEPELGIDVQEDTTLGEKFSSGSARAWREYKDAADAARDAFEAAAYAAAAARAAVELSRCESREDSSDH